jgi:hypothetical protein
MKESTLSVRLVARSLGRRAVQRESFANGACAKVAVAKPLSNVGDTPGETGSQLDSRPPQGAPRAYVLCAFRPVLLPFADA